MTAATAEAALVWLMAASTSGQWRAADELLGAAEGDLVIELARVAARGHPVVQRVAEIVSGDGGAQFAWPPVLGDRWRRGVTEPARLAMLATRQPRFAERDVPYRFASPPPEPGAPSAPP